MIDNNDSKRIDNVNTNSHTLNHTPGIVSSKTEQNSPIKPKGATSLLLNFHIADNNSSNNRQQQLNSVTNTDSCNAVDEIQSTSASVAAKVKVNHNSTTTPTDRFSMSSNDDDFLPLLGKQNPIRQTYAINQNSYNRRQQSFRFGNRAISSKYFARFFRTTHMDFQYGNLL